jgi:hypothetical protein
MKTKELENLVSQLPEPLKHRTLFHEIEKLMKFKAVDDAKSVNHAGHVIKLLKENGYVLESKILEDAYGPLSEFVVAVTTEDRSGKTHEHAYVFYTGEGWIDPGNGVDLHDNVLMQASKCFLPDGHTMLEAMITHEGKLVFDSHIEDDSEYFICTSGSRMVN